MDLTKITTPFGLLDAETQDALRAHHSAGEPIQHYTSPAWEDSPIPMWLGGCVYRAKPQPRQPREWWINHYGAAFASKRSAENHSDGQILIHVREVIE